MQSYIWRQRVAVFFAVCHLHWSVGGDRVSPFFLKWLCQRAKHSLPGQPSLRHGIKWRICQHFHWGKFPLGYSDDIKFGLDVQIKLKPQNGGRGEGYVSPDRFIEFSWETTLRHQLHLLWCLLPSSAGWNQITYFRLAGPLDSLYLSLFLWPEAAEMHPIYPFHGLLGQEWNRTQQPWNFSL